MGLVEEWPDATLSLAYAVGELDQRPGCVPFLVLFLAIQSVRGSQRPGPGRRIPQLGPIEGVEGKQRFFPYRVAGADAIGGPEKKRPGDEQGVVTGADLRLMQGIGYRG